MKKMKKIVISQIELLKSRRLGVHKPTRTFQMKKNKTKHKINLRKKYYGNDSDFG